MQASGPVCAQCGQVAAPGTQYCTRCGEAVDPTLVAELQRLYTTLRELDVRVVSGRGSQTVLELHDELWAHYLALRTEPGKEKTSPTAAPLAAAQAPAPVSAAPVSAPDRPSAVPPSAPIRQPRPAFSWQAFLAEQAIAIMAYLGAFLLIIATLAFELGGWQGLPDSIKLALMVVVYLIFGALGIVLRRARGLRTVGNAYLGVFALMTPLIALAVYRFELQSTGFPVAGMLCIAALYATVIYLALALRTSFATYAYLGWVALLVAVIATVPWSGVASEWWVFALVSVASALLFPDQISQLQIAALLGRPARHVSAVASSVGVVSVEVLGLLVWLERAGRQASLSIAAFALAAVVLAALAVGWSATMRQWMPHAAWLLTTLEASVGAFVAQAVIALAAWSGANPSQMAYVLALLGLAEMGAALVLRRVAPARAGLRYSVEGIALALTSLAALSVVAYPSPNWPLTAAYIVGILVTIGIVVAEGAPWWLLASGFFLTLVYQTIGTAILPPSHLAQDASPFYAALTLALWLLALGCGLRGVTRKYAAPIYVVAFGDALYTCVLLIFRREPGYQTAMLLIFALAAFIAARRERQPLVGGLAVGFFGVLACLPWALNESNTLYGSFLAVGLAVAALAVRRTLGRPWALPLYGVGLWAILLAGVHASVPGVTTEHVVALDLPFAAWLLIVYTALALVGAFWEGAPWAATVPAALGLWAMFVTGDRLSAVALLFGLVAVGAASRQWRGQWRGVPWYVAGAVGSVFVVLQLDQYGAAGRDGQVALLLALAVVAFAIAGLERVPYGTAVAALYAVAAVWAVPGPSAQVPTLVLTFAFVAVGVALSKRFGSNWALAAYGAAIGASLFAVARMEPFGAGQVEALLLVFAAVAYVVTFLEREPWAATAPMLYAFGAVVVQPDAHALLPLALGCAVGGLVVGRALGIRWSYPFYAAAVVAGVATAVLGRGDSSFEAWTLLALAVSAYVIAAVESQPEVLPVALLLGVLALAAGSGALGLAAWRVALSYAGLAWLYALGRYVWTTVPGLRPRGIPWWTARIADAERKVAWSDPRIVGAQVHRWAGVLVGGGAVVGGLLAPDAFALHASQTVVVGVTLLSLAGILAVLGRDTMFRLALYGAGGLTALAVTWLARWLGADNVQAFVLAPGSYLLLIGALLPADARVKQGEQLGQGASLAGSFLLLIPTLGQSFQSDQDWIYALVLAAEALVIAGVGLGARSRALIVVGSAFVVLAAVRGAIIAVVSGVPIAVVIGLAGALVLGAATWLSLRARRDATTEA